MCPGQDIFWWEKSKHGAIELPFGGYIPLTWSSKATSYWAQSSMGVAYSSKTCEKTAFQEKTGAPSFSSATERDKMLFPKWVAGKITIGPPQPRPRMSFVGTLTLLATLQGVKKRLSFFQKWSKMTFFKSETTRKRTSRPILGPQIVSTSVLMMI